MPLFSSLIVRDQPIYSLKSGVYLTFPFWKKCKWDFSVSLMSVFGSQPVLQHAAASPSISLSGWSQWTGRLEGYRGFLLIPDFFGLSVDAERH